MKQDELEVLSHDILLMLYDRTAKYRSGQWSFDSAFRALGIEAVGAQKEEVLDFLVGRGWLVAEKRSSTSGDRETPVELTERGRMAAVNILEAREPKKLLDRLHAMNWATWGGVAAVIAAIASVAAAIFAYMALR